MDKKSVYVIVAKEYGGERIRDIPVGDAGMEVILYQPKDGIIIGRSDDIYRAVEQLQKLEGVENAISGEELRGLLDRSVCRI